MLKNKHIYILISLTIFLIITETLNDFLLFKNSSEYIVFGFNIGDVVNIFLKFLVLTSILIYIFFLKGIIRKTKNLSIEAESSNSKFQNIFDLSPHKILLTTYDDGIIIDLNKSFCNYYAVDKEQLIGKKVSDLGFKNEDRERFKSKLNEGQVDDFLIKMKHKGVINYYSLSGKIMTINDERCVLSYSRDITDEILQREQLSNEFKEMEKAIQDRNEELQQLNEELSNQIKNKTIIQNALQESEKKYRTLVNHLPIGVYRTTKCGKFIHANPALAKILGHENVYDLINTSVYDYYFDKEDRDAPIRSSEDNNIIVKEKRLRRKDGKLIWVSDTGKLTPNEEGELILIDGIIQDITQNKKINDELVKSKQRYTRLFESLQDIYFRINKEGVIETVSPSIESIGFNPSDIIGYNIEKFILNEEKLEQFFERIKVKGSINNFVLPLINENEELHYLSLNAHFSIDEDTGITAIEGIAHDITKQIKSRDQLLALYSISKAVNSVNSLDKLFEEIHISLSKIINAKNFFIALVDEDRKVISIPYLKDEKDPYLDEIPLDHPKSLAAKVIREGRSLLMRKNDLIKFAEVDSNKIIGSIPEIWLGVALKSGNRVIGMMGVQDYHNQNAYNQEHVDLMISVSDQIALAIDRKQSQIKLNFQLKFLQNLMDTIPSPVFYKDKNKIYQGCNKAFEDYTGYTSQQIVGKSVHDIFINSEAEFYNETDDDLLENPGISIYEGSFRHSDGTQRTLLFHKSSYFDTRGNVAGIVGVIVDITDRKRIELELSWQADVNSAVAELSQEIISQTSVKDISDKLLHKMLSITKSNLGMAGYFDNDDKELEVLSYKSEVHKKNHIDSRLIIQHKNSLFRRLISSNMPYMSNNFDVSEFKGDIKEVHDDIQRIILVPALHAGEVIGILAVANKKKEYTEQDLSTMKRLADIYALMFQHIKAENEIKNALLREQELNLMKSRFISMVSHEYRTPLTAIMLSTELLQQYSHQLDKANKEKHFDRITQSVNTMNSLLDDIITFNKTEVNKNILNKNFLDIEKMSRSIISSIEFMYKGKNKINLEIHGEPKLIYVDENILRKILTNILTNAVKYSDNGETVEFILNIKDKEVEFIIQDNGIGISKEDMEKIFVPFHRGENVKNISGTGLGMSIIKNSVEMHLGKMNISSELNKGTTITVAIPFEKSKKILVNNLN